VYTARFFFLPSAASLHLHDLGRLRLAR